MFFEPTVPLLPQTPKVLLFCRDLEPVLCRLQIQVTSWDYPQREWAELHLTRGGITHVVFDFRGFALLELIPKFPEVAFIYYAPPNDSLPFFAANAGAWVVTPKQLPEDLVRGRRIIHIADKLVVPKTGFFNRLLHTVRVYIHNTLVTGNWADLLYESAVLANTRESK